MIIAGIDVLERRRFSLIEGARVGIVTNHTGHSADGRSTVEVLVNSKSVEVVALFGPEHGLQGRVYAGEKVGDSLDEETGLQVHSLYGEARRPGAALLEGLDTLVFDMQDVGARYYTYPSTMAYCLEACATNRRRFVVLDRPNPINGLLVEGPTVQEAMRSFIGYLQVPIRHGLTMGELARYHKSRSGLDVELEVVPMQGWRRGMWFDETGLSWTPPSPAMLALSTATLYPGTCLLEATNVSVGRGTEHPFEQVGAPWIDERILCEDMQSRELPGVAFEPVEFCPAERDYADEDCAGVFIQVVDRDVLCPVTVGHHLLDALHRHNPDEFRFDRIARHIGNEESLARLKAFTPVEEIARDWQREAEEFEGVRREYLLYD